VLEQPALGGVARARGAREHHRVLGRGPMAPANLSLANTPGVSSASFT
jgi:hypothetical protein